jgi:Tripartite tricarboxylate transporter family receptor
LAELPTIAESGVPGYDYTAWYGLYVPAKTPGEIVRKLHDDAAAALSHPQVTQRFAEIATVATPSTTTELAALLIKSDMELWGPIIKAANIKAEWRGGRTDEPKRDLLSLERRRSITVDQRDLSPGMVVHPVDAACRDEVARLDDKVLHANSIRGKSAALNAPDGVVSRLQGERIHCAGSCAGRGFVRRAGTSALHGLNHRSMTQLTWLLVDREISRFPYKKRTNMPGSATTPGRLGTRG